MGEEGGGGCEKNARSISRDLGLKLKGPSRDEYSTLTIINCWRRGGPNLRNPCLCGGSDVNEEDGSLKKHRLYCSDPGLLLFCFCFAFALLLLCFCFCFCFALVGDILISTNLIVIVP